MNGVNGVIMHIMSEWVEQICLSLIDHALAQAGGGRGHFYLAAAHVYPS